MKAPTDLETARQLDMLWRKVTEGIAKASEGIVKSDRVLEQAREVRAEVQTEISRAQAVQSEIAELVEHSRLLVQQTEGRAKDVLRVQSELEKLHQAVTSAVNQLGGSVGLESLRQEYQAVRNLLSETYTGNKQLKTEAEQKLQALQVEASRAEDKLNLTQQRVNEINDMIAAAQKTVSKVEQRSSEVSNLAQQVRADREAIQSIILEAESLRTADQRRVNALETLVHEQRGEIERLNNQLRESQAELGQRLQTQAQSQQRLSNWLLGVTFGVALALALAILVAR